MALVRNIDYQPSHRLKSGNYPFDKDVTKQHIQAFKEADGEINLAQ